MEPKDYEKLSIEDQTAYWQGRLLVSIGKGLFDYEIYAMINFLTRDAYARGVASIKEKE